jgi:hypothetical protein
MTYFVMLVVIGAAGIVTKGLKEYLEAIPGKHSIDSLQKKTAVLGMLHVMREVLQPRSLSDGEHRWFQRSTRKNPTMMTAR